MNMLISSDEQLRHFIPNCLKTVEGELPLFSKTVPFIRAAQSWLENTFFSGSDLLKYVNEDSNLYELCVRIVAYETYRRALPALDIVLTPNGLATVGNHTLSPASRMRVDALGVSIVSERDDAVVQLVHALASADAWRSSESGCWFSATLSPFPEVVRELGVVQDIWNKYLQVRSKMIEFETSLAERWFSRELFASLRKEVLKGVRNDKRCFFVNALRSLVISMLRDEMPTEDTLYLWIDFVRRHPDAFPEWHHSSVAEWFRPPVFHNSKNSSGYFF